MILNPVSPILKQTTNIKIHPEAVHAAASGYFSFGKYVLYNPLFLIRCFKLFGKYNNLLVRLFQFNSVVFQLVKQGKCFLFRKVGMKFFHRLVIQYAYAPEL